MQNVKPKLEARAVFVMDYNDWDKLVREAFPEREDYESVAEHEWNNYSSYYVRDAGAPKRWREDIPADVQEKLTADCLKSDQDHFAKWLRREKYSGVGHHQIIGELIRRGVLEPGDYLIRVYW